MKWYDRQGQPLACQTSEDFARIAGLLATVAYKRIAENALADGKWVSTVWLGLDHRLFGGPPLIFETMVFLSKDALNALDCARYSTEAEAHEGHKAMVRKWKELTEVRP